MAESVERELEVHRTDDEPAKKQPKLTVLQIASSAAAYFRGRAELLVHASILCARLGCGADSNGVVHLSCKSQPGQDAPVIVLWFVAARPESPGQHIFVS
jgi:hypothetical protein